MQLRFVVGDVCELVFRTEPDGRRLFYSFGPWSWPYIVPDAETEQRLGDRHRWMVGILLGVILGGQMLLRKFDPVGFNTLEGFGGYLAVVFLSYLLLQGALVWPELRGLARPESRPSLHQYYTDMASEYSLEYLLVVFLAAIGMNSLGVLLLVSQSEPMLGWLWLGVFVPLGLGWTYAFVLKLAHRAP